jgi:carbon storage regulator
VIASRTIPIVGEAKDVLVLSRKIGERILIGDKITVTVVKVGHGGVRIGVEAPPELSVVREELAKELRRAEQARAQEAEPVGE